MPNHNTSHAAHNQPNPQENYHLTFLHEIKHLDHLGYFPMNGKQVIPTSKEGFCSPDILVIDILSGQKHQEILEMMKGDFRDVGDFRVFS